MLPTDIPPGEFSLHLVSRPAADSTPNSSGCEVHGSCGSCSLRGVCLPRVLEGADLALFSEVAQLKRALSHGMSLYRAGQLLDAVYVIHSGSFKTVGVSREGSEKVTGFYLPGEMLGLGSISTGSHAFDAIALERSEVCVIPYARLQRLSSMLPALQQQFFRTLSADIARDQGLMLLLGGMSAEQRLAAFLMSLSRRYARLGYSAETFVLRMTREEIGSYIGLALETVSRLVSRLQREGIITVHHRDVRLVDVERLNASVQM